MRPLCVEHVAALTIARRLPHQVGAGWPGIATAVGGLGRTHQQEAPDSWWESGAFRMLGSGQ